MSNRAYLTLKASEYLARTGSSTDPAKTDFDSGVFSYARDKLRRQRNWRLDGHIHFVYHGATSGGKRVSAEDTILDPPETVDLTGSATAVFSAIRDSNRRPEECFLCYRSQTIPQWHAFDTMSAPEQQGQGQASLAEPTQEEPTATAVVRRMSVAASGAQVASQVIQGIASAPRAVASAVVQTVIHPVGTFQEAQAAAQDMVPVILHIAKAPVQAATEAYNDLSATTARLGALRISAQEPWSFIEDVVEDTGTEDPVESEDEFGELPSQPTLSGEFLALYNALDQRLSRINRVVGIMFEYSARGQILARLQQIFNIEAINVEGVRVQGREFAMRDNESSFRRLWTALSSNYDTQWQADGIPVKVRPRSLEINFLYFCYHSGTSGNPIVSPPLAVPRTPIDQDFEASRTATGMAAILRVVGQNEPNVIMIGELTTSVLLLNNKAIKRKLGQLERAIVFLCIHYNVKPTRMFAFLHTLEPLRDSARAFRNGLLSPEGFGSSFPILARMSRDERFVILPP
ncbi:hypothetical protein DFJ77DRAFT_478499 [Powellomyces hirtus]|nr:hypothetical protein DFJ77DRAFT_478499 [Powellomyces hirtus]